MKDYHQCPLDENTQLSSHHMADLNFFMSLMETHQHYNRRMAEAFTGLTGFQRIIDNIVIYDSAPQQHTTYVMQLLQTHCTQL